MAVEEFELNNKITLSDFNLVHTTSQANHTQEGKELQTKQDDHDDATEDENVADGKCEGKGTKCLHRFHDEKHFQAHHAVLLAGKDPVLGQG